MSEPQASPETEEEFAARQAAEYGTWVAKGPIYHDGALAYTEGHPVPVSNVERYKYDAQDLVRRVDEKSAAEPAAAKQISTDKPKAV